MSFSRDDIELMDQRIRAAQRKTSAMGTVISRDTTGPGALVMQDGATTPTPALVPGSVFCQPGDWITLDLYGTQWIVTNSFASFAFGEGSRFYAGLNAPMAAVSSGSFIDFGQVEPITFTKFHDLTFVLISASYGGYVDTAGDTEIEWAVRFTQTDGDTAYVASDITVGSIYFNNVSLHLSQSQARRKTDIPAGTYTVSMRWRRLSGSGNGRANADDSYTLSVDERVRASVRVL